MNIQIYKKGEHRQLSSNFWQHEFECQCSRCSTVVIDMNHVIQLQELRDGLAAPINITSAYRCPEHNVEVGGAENSQHLYGAATDIQIGDMHPDEVADACESFAGLGRYDSFTHIDSRADTARWDKRSSKEYLPPEPTEDDINVSLQDLEDEIL